VEETGESISAALLLSSDDVVDVYLNINKIVADRPIGLGFQA
jgi:hypothetical protein